MTAICNLQSAICNRQRHALAFALALAVYFAATLPHLSDFPLIGQDEPWIAAPAANLAMHGVYGDDLFTGYYGMEQHTYNFPPLFPLAEALAFRLLGVAAWPARLVAVLFGASMLGLTYALGWQLYDGALGALAAWMLVGLRLALEPQASGVPFLDLARIARYDIAVPPLVLATLLCFVAAETADQEPRVSDAQVSQFSTLNSRFFFQWRYVATGVLAGMAALAHVYGGFVLALVGALLVWRDGVRVLRRPAPYLIAAGFALALLPWALYLAQDLPAYVGQMLPEQTRFQLWEPAFYFNGLSQEPSRYRRLLRMSGTTVLWPRLGIWVALLGLPTSIVLLFKRCLPSKQSKIQNPKSKIQNADRVLLLALPMFALLLALLVNLKFYNYIVVLLPFLSLNLALPVMFAWHAASHQPARRRVAAHLALGGLLALTLIEGMFGMWRSLHSAAAVSPYVRYTARVAEAIPPGARVLALHQFWFGVYPRNYIYRSMALVFYYSDPRFYRPVPLPMDQALALVAPEYILIDRSMAPELRMDLPIAAIADDQRQRFRRYMAGHCAQIVAQIDDPDYGDLAIYRLCP